MGWAYRQQYELNRMMGIPNHPPCANCGKIDGGYMGSTAWGHNYRCCSDRCGFRLKKRIENGMYIDKEKVTQTDSNQRFRIKQLEKQLKLNGIKPTKTSLTDQLEKLG